jgi:hypothetical protein
VGNITSVKYAADLSSNVSGSVHTEVLQIIGHPASVYKYSILFALSIKVGVEWSDYLDTALSSKLLFNLEFLLVIENSFDGDWFKRPFAFKLIEILGVRPQKLSPVLGSDIYWSLFKLFGPAISFVLFVFLLSVLILSKLLHEN